MCKIDITFHLGKKTAENEISETFDIKHLFKSELSKYKIKRILMTKKKREKDMSRKCLCDILFESMFSLQSRQHYLK